MSEKENITSTPEVDEKAEIALLKKQVQELMAALAAQNKGATPITVVTPDTDVHIVYMSDSLGHLDAGSIQLDATRYGEQFTVSKAQADAIVGKYRRWFDKGILAISADDLKYAAGKGLRTDAEFALTPAKLNSLGTMDVSSIEKLWESSSHEQRVSIVTFFKKKIIEHKDPNFLDRARVDALNRLSNGGFKREVSELSGDYYIRQTDM